MVNEMVEVQVLDIEARAENKLTSNPLDELTSLLMEYEALLPAGDVAALEMYSDGSMILTSTQAGRIEGFISGNGALNWLMGATGHK